MKPYYNRDGITIFNCDFREDAVQRHVKGANCIIADPPYGETSLVWDKWVPGWMDYLTGRVALNGSLWCFGSARMFFDHADEFKKHWRFVQDIVWEKHNGSSFVNDRFKRVHEFAYHFVLQDAIWGEVFKAPVFTADATKRTLRRKQRPPHTGDIGQGAYQSEDGGPRLMRSVIQARSCHGYAVNETQKPEAVVSPLIQYSCPPGGLVFSPFMGSGTDLVVARALGMRAVGCDVREEQCEAAAQRLAQALLFSEVAGG